MGAAVAVDVAVNPENKLELAGAADETGAALICRAGKGDFVAEALL